MDPIVISIMAFVGIAGMVGIVLYILKDAGATAAEDRLEIMTGKKAREEQTSGIMKEELISEGVNGLNNFFGNIINRISRLKLLFEQAESPLKPDAFFGISGVLALLGVAGAIIAKAPLPLYPLAALGTGSLPLLWLLMRRRRRFKAFAKQLPDALELIARALRSGHSLASGLYVVVEEMPAPISVEFGIAYEEQNLGVPLEDALKSMLDRMPNMDLKFFVTAVAIQRSAGGDMAEILEKIGYIIRERFKIMGQVQALTGEGRISGVVLMGLPIALFFAVYYLNPEYVMLLFTEELGKKMIAVAAVLQVLGAIAIKKIVAIKI
ncbi:MAG: type II secretion system F family protein [Planctomycetaceae bacterium]